MMPTTSPAPTKRTLAEFGKIYAKPPGNPCSVCQLPPEVLAQVNEFAWIDPATGKAKLSCAVIAKWLREDCGVESMNGDRIRNHVVKGHLALP